MHVVQITTKGHTNVWLHSTATTTEYTVNDNNYSGYITLAVSRHHI